MPKKKKPTAPLVPLTGKQKSYLRSLAHKLKPVVQIGHQGVTPGVLSALDVALERHELIKVKVKVAGEAEVDAADIGPQLEKATKSQVAQVIGHTLVVYRRRKENPKIVLPKEKPKRAGAAAAPAKKAAVEDDLDGEDDELEDDELDDEEDDEELEDDEDDDEDLEDDEDEEE